MDVYQLRSLLLWLPLICNYAATTFAESNQACWKDTPCDSRFTETAFPGPWEANILAPASRTVTPKYVLTRSLRGSNYTSGNDTGPFSRTAFDLLSSPYAIRGNGSQLIFDFGQEVGGIVTLRYAVSDSKKENTDGGDNGDEDSEGTAVSQRVRQWPGHKARKAVGSLGLAFAESSDFIGQLSDASNGAFRGSDGAIYVDLEADQPTESTYTMPDSSMRGGFRYLTVFLVNKNQQDTAVTVVLRNVTLSLSFQPTWPNLRAYQGYFNCDDKLLNRIWYAGAYTLQTNAVPPNTGRRVPFLDKGWANDGHLGPGNTILVDGAKRDRAVWPGDMGVAVPSLFVSTGDMESVKNALQTMYDHQNPDGSFPEAGPPLLQQGSDTYHMWTMIGTYNYVLYTNDTSFLAANWDRYLRAMTYITDKQSDYEESSLLHVTGVRDWARLNVGTNMTEAQAILYRTLITGAELAKLISQVSSEGQNHTSYWTDAARRLRNSTLKYCYDTEAGLFRDNAVVTEHAAIYPQDANSLSLAVGLVENSADTDDKDDSIAASISRLLEERWLRAADHCPVTPELPGHISPFISSWEVRGHFAVGETRRALELIRNLWGRYIDRTDGTQSSLVEGLLETPGGNASFAYRWNRGYGGVHNETDVAASYTSHSHGWSAGPTSALTEFVVGLSVVDVAGSAWKFAPQFGDLLRAEGGFVTPLGKFQARWQRCPVSVNGLCHDDCTAYEATVNTPMNTEGILLLPVFNATSEALSVVLDNSTINLRNHWPTVIGNTGHIEGVIELHVPGGMHFVQVKAS